MALSLGPFGASLFPAQEFDGFYPPPYGPKGYSLDEPNTNAFGGDGATSEQRALGALEQFHYDRLRVFADHNETWDKIDYIAFETVPLAREVKAIRRAVGRLAMDLQRDGRAEMGEDGDGGLMKPWWISTVWPNGRFPQESSSGGPHLAPADVLRSLIDDPSPSNPAPPAIGINCTDVSYLSSIVHQFRIHVSQSQPSQPPLSLIIYPNAGYSYDIWTKSWSLPSDEELSRKEWARKVGEVVRRERGTGTWKGIVVGGCCKAGPSHIAALVEEIRV
jgi:homocysteine S-methyltransferase